MTVVLKQDWQAAREHILTAMAFAERIFEEEAQAHTPAFVWQMREVLGRPAVLLNDHFLPFEQARAALWLLVALERIEAQLHRPRILPQREEESDIVLKAFDPRQPLLPQAQDRVAVEIDRHKYRFRQRLDKERQQSIGLTHYVWRTVGDDRVRDSHAALDGRTFAWGEGLEPGQDFGCRCTAEPSGEGAQLSNDPPLESVYWLEALLAILAVLASEIAIARALQVLDKFRRTIGHPPRQISRSELNPAQSQNLARFEKKLPAGTQPTKITRNTDGSVTFQSDVPARNIPGSYARYEKTVDAAGRTTGYTKTTYGPDGSVIHVKDKMGEL